VSQLARVMRKITAIMPSPTMGSRIGAPAAIAMALAM